MFFLAADAQLCVLITNTLIVNIFTAAIIVGTHTDTVITVADATTQLQQRYISSRFSSSVDEWPPYQPKHYTTLAFIHNKGRCTDAVRFSVAQELAVAGKVNSSQLHKYSHMNTNITKNISDIFLTSDGSSVDLHILIEGAPGIGKTVLAKEIAYQWAKKELLTSRKLLLLVFLRECHKKALVSIENLVQYVFKTSEMTIYFTKYLSATEGKDAAIIFDGFDELSEENRKQSIIVDIINRRILTKCCLVVTSRPTASSNLHGSVDRRVEIVGFTEEDRLNYIQSALENNDEQVKDLQHYLQSNPTINALCYIPLNMTILLCLFRDGIDRLPKTQTEMYKIFIEMTIVRFIKKHDNCDTIISIPSLPHPHNRVFVELAKLAYEALVIDKIVFTLPEIKEGCPNLTMTSRNWNGLGLLKAVKCFSEELCNDQVTFHFLHFSLQEYMAAWHISMLPESDQIKLLQKTFWEHRYYNVWIMYVGITHGNTFALRHFLSGNRFQFYTKLFNTSEVSSEYLNDKIKCLHLFQCLVEGNKEDTIYSVKKLFQNKQIDLSNQTLLPSDLNTFGFFVIRSINNEWDELNLSNCNIGSNGISILCSTFLGKDVRHMVTIKRVNFSYNQLNFSSLKQLFGLFNFWHTSELIITDDEVLNENDMKALEDIVLQSTTLVLALIGSFLFSKSIKPIQMLPIIPNTTSIRSVYLLNCSWGSTDSELLTLLEKQKLNKIRIIGSSLHKFFIRIMALILLNNNDSANMFVYNPTMPDQIADDISHLILRSNKDISGVILIVSKSKVQGIVNTCTLSNELSALELFNLSIYIRYLNTKLCLWKENLEGEVHNQDFIGFFVDLLCKVDYNWNLKIILQEIDTVVIHKGEYKSIKLIQFSKNSVVCLSSTSGDVIYNDKVSHNKSWDEVSTIIKNPVSELYIINCVLQSKKIASYALKRLSVINGTVSETALIEILKGFIHKNFEVSISNVRIIDNDRMIRNLITSKEFYFDMKLNLVLSTEHWLYVCNVTKYQLNFIQQYFMNQTPLDCNGITVATKLPQISGDKMYMFENDLLKVVGLCAEMPNATDTIQMIAALSNVTSVRTIEIDNCSITTDNLANVLQQKAELQELCLVGNCLQTNNTIKVITALTLTKLSICDNNITDDAVGDIATVISHNIHLQELNLGNNHLQTSGAIKVARSLQKITSLTKLYINHNSITNEAADDIAAAISHNIGLQEVNIGNNHLQTSGAVKVARSLQKISSLTKLYINHNSITHEAADDIAAAISHNIGLQELNLGNNFFQVSGAIKVTRSLQKISSLTKLYINHNGISYKATDDIAVAISYNAKLQEFDVSGNNIQTAGAIKIMKALKDICNVKRLCFSNNNITDGAADEIAAAVSCNSKLQHIDLSENDLQTNGTVRCMKALKNIHMLKILNLNNNKISVKAADDMARAISYASQLNELDVSNNNLETEGIRKILKSLKGSQTLTKLYISNNYVTDKAPNDIAAAISCIAGLQEFDVSGNDLQASGVIIIAKGLQKLSTLTRLLISHNHITYVAADDIAAAISHNIGLQELNLGNNFLQVSGAIKVTRSLQKISSLTKLYINHNGISYDAADDIAAAISCNTKLQEFDVSGNNIQTAGAIKIMKALKDICTVKRLCFSNNNITDGAADEIAAVVSCNIKLQYIDLSENDLQTNGTVRCMKALKNIHMLKILNLNNNKISVKAADDMARAISYASQLNELNVSNNNLETEGIRKILKSLKGSQTLTKLYISNNYVTDKAPNDIAAAISCIAGLQEFDVSGNDLQASGAIIIAKGLQKLSTLTRLSISHNHITCVAADDIAAAISHNIGLQELNIGNNSLQSLGAIKISKVLQNLSTLTKLYMPSNLITDEAADSIATAICSNIHLQEFNISNNHLTQSGCYIIAKASEKISRFVI